MSLDAQQVAVELNRVPILKDVSFSAGSGEFVGVIGPNGSGKSTLLKTCAGLQKASSGTVSVAGKAINRLSASTRARALAYIPQYPAPHPFSVAAAITMARYAFTPRVSFGDRGTDALLERELRNCQLEELRNRSYNTLSGGEARRVAFARAMVQDTPMLLLDEPVSGMDLNHCLATMLRMKRAAEGGKLVLAALHNLEHVSRFCSRLLLMKDGTLLADGTPEEVLTQWNLKLAFNVDSEVSRHSGHGELQIYVKDPKVPF